MPFDIKAAKQFFFDRERVQKALAAGKRRGLSRFGAFVRTRARSSIRKRKATSKPGQPPSSHEGSLRRLLLFAYDAARESVVIGPVPFGTGEAPALLESGGTVTRRTRDGVKTLYYRARPFMGPAFRAELPQAPQVFRDAVR